MYSANRTRYCRGAACRSRRKTSGWYRLALKWHQPPNLSLRGGRRPTWQSREGSCDFADGFPVVRPCSARFPRRFAPRNDKPEGPAPLNQWRKYCCSPRRSGNTATFFSRAAAFPLGLFPFTVLHIIENYGIFSAKILTKKLRGDMLDLPEGTTCQTFNWNGRRKCP